ncbi:MAG: hypothetical protein LJF04_19420 [Gemmatimonadetes bacterium]|jgi:hypothetical protein|nr:hypothetical protein [Gemmatimonadota bacterium]
MSGTSGARYRFSSGAFAGWLHFVVLLALGIGADVVRVLLDAGWTQRAGTEVMAGLPQWAFHLIPVVVAISIGMLRFTPAIARQGLRLAVVTTVLMVGLDLVVPQGPLGDHALAFVQGEYGQSRVVDESDVSAVGTALTFLHGDLAGWSEVSETYPPGHPRLRAALAMVRGAYLVLPLILVGLVLGVQVWVAESVTFRTVPAERIARLLMAWVVSAGAYFLIMSWTGAVSFQLLGRPGPLLPILLPLLPFALVGLMGWYKSWHATRWLH